MEIKNNLLGLKIDKQQPVVDEEVNHKYLL